MIEYKYILRDFGESHFHEYSNDFRIGQDEIDTYLICT